MHWFCIIVFGGPLLLAITHSFIVFSFVGVVVVATFADIFRKPKTKR
jgi:hypothetical protein